MRSVESLKKIRQTREKFLGLELIILKTRIFFELEFSNNIYNEIRCPIINLDEYSVEEASEFIKKRIGFKEE